MNTLTHYRINCNFEKLMHSLTDYFDSLSSSTSSISISGSTMQTEFHKGKLVKQNWKAADMIFPS